VRVFLAAMLLAAAPAASAAPLTVHAGESWLFTVRNGEPANARKVQATAKPARGEVMASVRSLFGTMLIVTNNSAVGYKFTAELLPGTNISTVRTCLLPPGGKPTLEQWGQKADAVRIGNFRATANEGLC
jgi:hypothetical protein